MPIIKCLMMYLFVYRQVRDKICFRDYGGTLETVDVDPILDGRPSIHAYNCQSNCSGHGICIHGNNCLCNYGYQG